jgi:hypothetical protein|tara:strand:- start:2401 stop:2895 length:495 start_codon:yes stop_codon:yes gene_type:complete
MIAEEIRKSAGKRNRSGDWYISKLEEALAPLQNKDISTSDTGWLAVGQLLSFSYGAAFPERMEFWDIQPLSFVLEIYKDGFLGANLHYINPDYRDAVAKSLINSGRGASVPRNSLHRYLFSGMGNVYQVPESEDWASISLLPTEKFYDNRGMKYPKHKAWNWRK